MALYRKNTFEGGRVEIDGHTFEENTFRNCVLVYGGGPLHFSGNKLIDVRWEFVDSAARTLALLSSFYRSGGVSRKYVETLLENFAQNPGHDDSEKPPEEERDD
ncbi:MAG: hypothetical protein JJU27_12195 [Gammaproteobacteria bacterium]|nr:hypothetical protein [Gammaproteobacteria bacterium]